MRIALVQATASAFLIGLVYVALLLTGLPPLIVAAAALGFGAYAAHQAGWRGLSSALIIIALVPLAAVVLLTMFGVSIAMAQSSVAPPDTVVVVPWGDWLGPVLTDAAGLLATIIMAVILRFLPASLRAWLTAQRTAQLEQLLERALGYAAQKTAVAVQGRTFDVDVHTELLAKGAQYAINNGPKKLIEWAGGEKAIIDKLTARIPTSPSVKAVTLTPAAATP